jgi:hypothetical protein
MWLRELVSVRRVGWKLHAVQPPQRVKAGKCRARAGASLAAAKQAIDRESTQAIPMMTRGSAPASPASAREAGIGQGEAGGADDGERTERLRSRQASPTTMRRCAGFAILRKEGLHGEVDGAVPAAGPSGPGVAGQRRHGGVTSVAYRLGGSEVIRAAGPRLTVSIKLTQRPSSRQEARDERIAGLRGSAG